jgi:hypothetical protein
MITLSHEKISQLDDSTRRFAEALKRGVDAFLEAGRIVAQEIDKDPKFPEKVAAQSNGDIPAVLVRRFEKLGRGQVIPQFLLHWDKPGVKKLRKFTPDLQTKYLKEGLEVLVDKGQHLLINPLHMTKLQAQQVFECDEIRSLPEQRAWLESEKMTVNLNKTEKVEDLYNIVKGQIVFNRPCHFNVDELMQILVNRRRN